MICVFECVRGHTQLGIKATGARSAIRIHAATMHVCVLCSPIPPSPNPDPPSRKYPVYQAHTQTHTHTHNRETANAEYANRMAGADTLAAARNKACEIKVKTFTAVAASIDKQVRFR